MSLMSLIILGSNSLKIVHTLRVIFAKLYNELPLELRKAESFKQYEGLLKKHFSLDY